MKKLLSHLVFLIIILLSPLVLLGGMYLMDINFNYIKLSSKENEYKSFQPTKDTVAKKEIVLTY